MNRKLRFVLAVLAGVLAGSAVVAVIELVGHLLFPAPDTTSTDALCEYIAQAPLTALLFPLFGWVSGAFVAGLIAKLIFRSNNKPAFVAGVVHLVFILSTFFLVLCHPIWMEVLGAILPVPMAMIGARLLPTR